MDQIIKVAWELNENSENRYKLVYEVAELAKKLVDEAQMKKVRDEFGFEEEIQAFVAHRLNNIVNVLMLQSRYGKRLILLIKGIEHQSAHALLIFIYMIHQDLQIYWCCGFLHTIQIFQVFLLSR